MQRTERRKFTGNQACFWLILAMGCGKSEPPDHEFNGLGGASDRWPDEGSETQENQTSEENETNPWLDFGASPSSSGGGTLSRPGDEPLHFSSGGAGSSTSSVSSGGGTQHSEEDEERLPPPQTGGGQNEGELPPPAAVILPELRLIEYWEGPGSLKVLGMRNTGEVPARDCLIEIYSNGGTSPWRSLVLPELASDEATFLCTSAVERSDCSHPLGTSTFNGNDALVVRCGDEVTDSMGRVGEDPGEAWTSPSRPELRSQDARLWRCGVNADVDPFDPFLIAEDWERVDDGAVVGVAFLGCSLGPDGLGGASSG